jgi:hypothetical protein
VTGYLAEVPEAEASGSVAEVYADIRRVLGLPLVNLVYRHLAVGDGRLETTWAALRPNLVSPAAQVAANELVSAAASVPGVLSIPRTALDVAGVGDEGAAIHSTLDAYARANSRNILGMHTLLVGVEGGVASGAPIEPPQALPVLPFADLGRIRLETLSLLEEISFEISGVDEPRIVPSLLRHFAHSPCLLALVWTVLRPVTESGEVARLAGEIASRAGDLVRSLPHQVPASADEPIRTVASRFIGAMSRMLVVGELIRASVEEAS